MIVAATNIVSQVMMLCVIIPVIVLPMGYYLLQGIHAIRPNIKPQNQTLQERRNVKKLVKLASTMHTCKTECLLSIFLTIYSLKLPFDEHNPNNN